MNPTLASDVFCFLLKCKLPGHIRTKAIRIEANQLAIRVAEVLGTPEAIAAIATMRREIASLRQTTKPRRRKIMLP